MAIVKMQRVAVIGLDEHKESVMSRLMDFGAVELVDQRDKLSDRKWSELVTPDDGHAQAAALDAELNRAENALEILEKYDSARGPLFKTRRSMKEKDFAALKKYREEAESDVSEVLEAEASLREAKEHINRLEQDRLMLSPWIRYGLPLQIHGTAKTLLHLGVIPIGADADTLAAEIDRSGGVMVTANSDKDLLYVGIINLARDENVVLELLKKNGFSETQFRDFEGTPAENINRIDREKQALEESVAAIEKSIGEKSPMRPTIENYRDMLAVDAEKEKIKSKLLRTKSTFYLEGWIPERLTGKAAKLLDGLGCYYGFRPPEEGEETRVLLDNRNFFVPFEAITEMYSLPAYGSFDPTSIFALFYAVFFGMMLSDAGYGIIMTAACILVLRKFNLEGTTYKMIKLFMYCGISTVIWGALFGGWFGDFIQVFARTILGREVVIEPLWFNPLDDPMKLLIFSLALGVIHLFIGMGIKAYMQIREGHWFDALCDEGFWYLTILGLIAWLGGSSISPALTGAGKWMSIIGAAGLLLTGGRHNKGIGKITGGLSNIYNVTGYMSDILSYARLLALGLATGVIAQVVNTMGSLFGGGVAGLIILLVMFVFGHALNLAINALGAFIHASRLQYVEFFGKFYEDGGEPFEPFRKKTKYIRIEQEEEER